MRSLNKVAILYLPLASVSSVLAMVFSFWKIQIADFFTGVFVICLFLMTLGPRYTLTEIITKHFELFDHIKVLVNKYQKIIRGFINLILAVFSLYQVRQIVIRGIVDWQKYQNFEVGNLLSQSIFVILMPTGAIAFGFVLIYLISFKNHRDKFFITLALLLALSNFAHRKYSEQSTAFAQNPHIYSVTPSETQEAWLDVGVSGANFGEPSFVGKIVINNTEQIITRWSDKKIYFRTNPEKTSSGEVCVITAKGTKSNCQIFKYHFK